MANNKDFRVKNNIFVTGLGTSTFSGDVSIGDTLSVQGTSTFAGDVNLGGNDFLNIGSITTTGNATIGGNLTVQGTTTWLDTTNTQIKDANIVLNYSTGDSSGNANGAGITIQDAVNSTTDATLLWNATNDEFDFSHTITLPDTGVLKIGNSDDIQLSHSGVHSYFRNYTGNLYFVNYSDDKDIVFESDNGSGGVTAYLTIDGSAGQNRFNANALFFDNKKALFGDGADLEIFHNGTNSVINDAGTGDLVFQSGGSEKARFTSTGFTLIGSYSATANYNTSLGGYQIGGTTVIDNSRNLTNIGTGSFSGTVSINQGSSFSKLQIGTGRTGATENIGAVEFLNSSSALKAQVYGSNDGQLRLTTNGSTVAVRLDSSQNAHFEGDISLPDVKKIKLGTGDDLLLYHDSESVIEDAGTNGLDIRTNGPAVSISGASDLMAKFIKDGAVELYHDNVKRLQTTSSGVEMINGLVVQGATSFNDDANFGAALQLNGTTVTSTAAELNKLDGFTGTVADLNYAKDLRATGVTATEFDYLDGVTSNIQTQIDAVQTVTINNNADNRLITGSGTAQTVNAETNLLFGATGNTLEVKGSPSGGVAGTVKFVDNDHTDTFGQIYEGDGVLYFTSRNNTSHGAFKFVGQNGSTTPTYGGFDASGNFEIGTTDVIDSSRNLVNINNIDLTSELNFTGNSSKYIDFHTLANSNSINLRHHNPTGNLFETAAVFNANGGGIINYDGSARMTTQSAGIKVNSAAVGGVAAPILNVGQLNNAYQSGMESSVHLTMKTYNPSGNFYFYKQSSILASIINGDFCIGQTAVIDSSRNLVNIGSISNSGNITSSGNIDVNSDSGQLQFGADNDMQIFHNGANGEINNATGNFTIDSAGDIALDADGGDIRLYDGGTLYANLANSSGNFAIKNPTQDKDITFIGNDGGSTITALTLDMSAQGKATFNNDLVVPNAYVQNLFITSSGTSTVNRLDNDGNTFYLTHGDGSSRALEIHNTTGNVSISSGSTFQIAGVNVIDTSRNLVNIGTISSGAITSSGTLKSTSATGLILDTGSAYRDVQFVLTGNTGNGTLEIIPMTVPGSGTAIYTTHFKNLSATGTTRHDLKVDGDIRAGGGDYFTNSGAAGNYRGFGDRLGLSIVNGASYIYDAASTPVIALAAYAGNVHIYNELKMGNLSGTTVIDSSRNLVNIGTISSGAITSTGSSTFADTLTVSGASQGGIRLISANTQTSFVDFGDPQDSNVGLIAYSHSNNEMFFRTNATEALRFDSSQNATFTGDIDLADAKKIKLGNGDDLQIYHTGSHSYIYDTGTGNLVLKGQEVVIQSGNSTESKAIFRDDGAAELYFNDSLRIATTSGGVDVTGEILATSTITSNGKLVSTADGSEGGHLLLRANSGGAKQYSWDVDSSNAFRMICEDDGTGNNGFVIMKTGSSGQNIRFQKSLRMINTEFMDTSRNMSNIGTISSGNIHISGGSSTFRLTDTGITDANHNTLVAYAAAQNKFALGVSSTTGTSADLTIDGANNRIGIGTTSPSGKVHVYDSGTDTYGTQPIAIFDYYDTDDAALRYSARIGDGSTTFKTFVTGSLTDFLIVDQDNTAGRLAFQVQGNAGNIEALAVDSTGLVGIGTTTPSEKLHIAQSTADHLTLKLEQDNASYESWFEANSQDGGFFRAGISTNASNYAFFNTDQASYRWFGAGGGSPSMTLTNGNLGINTTHPDSKLDVTGGDITVNTTGTGFMNFKYNNGSTGTIGTDGIDLKITANADLQILPTGNVGIGETAPDVKLHITDTTQELFKLETNQTSGYARFYEGASERLRIGFGSHVFSAIPSATDVGIRSSNNMHFGTDNNIRMTILDASGNVGIGTTAPASKLHLQDGDFRITGIFPRIYLQDSNNNPDYSIFNGNGTLRFYDDTNSADRLAITTTGVGIGTTAPSNTLDVVGGVEVSNGIFVNATGISQFSCDHTTSADDWAQSPISIRERGLVNNAQSANSYSPNLNFHWGGRVSRSLTMKADGNFILGEWTSSGAPQTGSGLSNLNLGSININNVGVIDSSRNLTNINYLDIADKIQHTGDTDTNIQFFTDTIQLKTGNNLRLQTNNSGVTVLGVPLHISQPNGAEIKFNQTTSSTTASKGSIQWFDSNSNSCGTINLKADGAEDNSGVMEFYVTAQTDELGDDPFGINKMMTITESGVQVHGSLSKSSGSFKIDHPLKPDTHHLVHSFVEGPQADNLYRGKIELKDGRAVIDLDEWFGMTPGTFLALNRDLQAFVSNEEDWDAVRAKVMGSQLVIECQNARSKASVSWLVVGERQDNEIYESSLTDDYGKIIVEPVKQVVE